MLFPRMVAYKDEEQGTLFDAPAKSDDRQWHIHYRWIGGKRTIDYSPFATKELARAAADEFNATHDGVHEAYAVVVAHKKARR